jgi:hypothetical protein
MASAKFRGVSPRLALNVTRIRVSMLRHYFQRMFQQPGALVASVACVVIVGLACCLAATASSAEDSSATPPNTDRPVLPGKMFLADDARSSTYVPLLDDVPLFISTRPGNLIGNNVALNVEITRFISAGECTQDTWPRPPEESKRTEPSAFALAKVVSVQMGSFASDTVMLCGSQTRERFSLGQRGLVYGTPSQNQLGRWRVVISETYRQQAARRRSEGATCVLLFCFDLPKIFN